MPKISIIVPVYNAEQWLERCINSIVAQTYADWELLLVDDGSTDRSGDICDRYAASDPRIQVFHKPNGGVSSARNLGLDHAKGEWITFVDADDYIPVQSLQYLVNNNNEDLIIGAYEIIGQPKTIDIKLDIDTVQLQDIDSLVNEYIGTSLLSSPWCKLFKNYIITKYQIHFNEKIILGEDAIFVLEYLLKTNSIRIIHKSCYLYELGDENNFTKKYCSNSESNFNLYGIIRELHDKLEIKYSIIIDTSLPNMVFELTMNSIKLGYSVDRRKFFSFLRRQEVQKKLLSRNSKKVKTIVYLSKFTTPNIVYWFIKTTFTIKKILSWNIRQ